MLYGSKTTCPKKVSGNQSQGAHEFADTAENESGLVCNDILQAPD